MAEIKWSANARRDIEKIFDYYALESHRYASKLTEGMTVQVSRLVQFPRLGRTVPEIGDENIRELLHRGYRIVYWWEEGIVEILTIFHSSQQFGAPPNRTEE